MTCLLSAKAVVGPLFDHFVGAGEQRWRYREAERFRGLEIDRQLVLGWRPHRQVHKPTSVQLYSRFVSACEGCRLWVTPSSLTV